MPEECAYCEGCLESIIICTDGQSNMHQYCMTIRELVYFECAYLMCKCIMQLAKLCRH